MVTAGQPPREALAAVERCLEAAGCPDAACDARELFRLATGRDPRLSDRPLSPEEAGRLEEMARRRAGREPLHTMLGGKVPVVVVDHHGDDSADVYGTITHNRARGTHLLEPMKAIVKRLIDEGKSIQEIGKQLGMKPEEVFRLSDFTRDDFLEMMTKGVSGYSRAAMYRKV